MEQGKAAMEDALKEAFMTGEYSDLTIICGHKRFKVHKIVMCTRSKVFASYCEDARCKKSGETTITLPRDGKEGRSTGFVSDDPDAVACMLEFIYFHDYDLSKCEWVACNGPGYDLVLHAKLYALGEKYIIPSLKQAALDKFDHGIWTTWSSAMFPLAIETVFETTPDHDKGLRNIVIETLHYRKQELASSSEVGKCIRLIDGLAYDLWKRTNETGPRSCLVCNKVYMLRCRAQNCINEFVMCDCLEREKVCHDHHSW